MSYVLVSGGIIQSEGGLPAAARRLDTQQWVMPNGGLVNATVAEQQACGYFAVTDTARPADTATDTYDRSVTLDRGVPTVTWTQRRKTAEEVAGATATANQSAIVTNLAQDMAAIQAMLDATNATINANPASYMKPIGRMLRRLGRLASNDLTGST